MVRASFLYCTLRILCLFAQPAPQSITPSFETTLVYKVVNTSQCCSVGGWQPHACLYIEFGPDHKHCGFRYALRASILWLSDALLSCGGCRSLVPFACEVDGAGCAAHSYYTAAIGDSEKKKSAIYKDFSSTILCAAQQDICSARIQEGFNSWT